MAPRPEYSAMPQVVTIIKLLLNLQSWTESVSLQWPGCNSALLLRLSYFAVHYFALSPDEFIWLGLILMSTDFLMSNKRASQVRCWIFLKGTKHYYFPSHWKVGESVWGKKKRKNKCTQSLNWIQSLWLCLFTQYISIRNWVK